MKANRYKEDAWITFREAARPVNYRHDGMVLYLALSTKNAKALKRIKKAWGMTWNEWATEILELIEAHG